MVSPETRTVHQILVQHFHAFQSESIELNDCLQIVLNELNSLSLCHEMEAMSVSMPKHKKTMQIPPTASNTIHLQGETGKINHSNNTKVQSNKLKQQVSDSLLSCLEHMLISESAPSIEMNENSDSLYDLMAAIAVAFNILDSTFYHLLSQASLSITDRVRLLSCIMLYACVKQNPQDAEKLIPILLPRLSDKAQSVRLAAIQACMAFPQPTQQLTDALLWNMHHDPSYSNRCAALQSSVHMNCEIQHIIRRIRDVKAKVRVAAIHRLHHVPIRHLLPDHFAAIVRAGITDRCKETCDATTTLVCTRWIKFAKYDPLVLLSSMNPPAYEAECEKVITTLLKASPDVLKDLSEAEVFAFRQGMTIQPNVDDLLPSNLLVARLQCEHETVPAKRLDKIQKIVPDVHVLCDAIQKCIDILAEQQDEAIGYCCNQLFRMAHLMDLQEEGSRRHFLARCESILSSDRTPEEILEEAVKAMGRAHDREDIYLASVTEIIGSITDKLRIVTMLALVLENTSPRMADHPIIQNFIKHIIPSLQDTNAMTREASVCCLGRLALLSGQTTVLEDFKPILFGIISKQNETLEVRAQAMLALCDLTMLYDDMLLPVEVDGKNFELVDHVREMLQNDNPSVVAVAAEVASKLLFSGKVQDCKLVPCLLVVFFNKIYNDFDEDEDVLEVGSVYRMQQLLSLFFPAYSRKGFQLIPAIGPMLEIAATRKRGRKAFPISKMIEYVYATAEDGMEKSKDGNDQPQDNALLVCLELAMFLLRTHENLSITNIRIICKLLGGADVDLEKSSNTALVLLKEKVYELTTWLSDQASLESLETMVELLEDVHSDSSGDGNNLHDLVEVMNAVTLEKENPQISSKSGVYQTRSRQALGAAN